MGIKRAKSNLPPNPFPYFPVLLDVVFDLRLFLFFYYLLSFVFSAYFRFFPNLVLIGTFKRTYFI